ncbi:MAG: hypothetical protein IJS12_10785 [Lachnospiraceae bacterium]|nr:hypothetical protein [Lachnospiraceae bacterium]
MTGISNVTEEFGQQKNMMVETTFLLASAIMFAQKLSRSRNGRISACTANVIKGVEEFFARAGMDDFLPKPVQFDALSAQLYRLLK